MSPLRSYSPLQRAKPPLKTHARALEQYAHSNMQPGTTHARAAHTFTDTDRGNIQTGMHNKGKSLWAPQLISCMEIIFKTEQNGGPSLGGRVGLRRAPGARWHVTVYACLLNKRCWPRWKSAIGHLICPTCVIGPCPDTQYSFCPIALEPRWSQVCKMSLKCRKHLDRFAEKYCLNINLIHLRIDHVHCLMHQTCPSAQTNKD